MLALFEKEHVKWLFYLFISPIVKNKMSKQAITLIYPKAKVIEWFERNIDAQKQSPEKCLKIKIQITATTKKREKNREKREIYW